MAASSHRSLSPRSVRLHTTAVVSCSGVSNHNDQHKLAGNDIKFCVGDDCSQCGIVHTSRVSGVRLNCVLAVTRWRRHQPIASTSKLASIISSGRSPNKSIITRSSLQWHEIVHTAPLGGRLSSVSTSDKPTTPSGQAGVTIMSVGDDSLPPVKACQTVNQSINISGVRPER